MERVKSANSPSKSVDGIKSLKFRHEKVTPRHHDSVMQSLNIRTNQPKAETLNSVRDSKSKCKLVILTVTLL